MTRLQTELDKVWHALWEFLLYSMRSKLSLGLLHTRHLQGAQPCKASRQGCKTRPPPPLPPRGCPSRHQPQLVMPRPFSTLGVAAPHQYPKAMLSQGFTGWRGLLREETGESQLSDHPRVGGELFLPALLAQYHPFSF